MQKISEALRVDHAGELGAVRLYEGQIAVLGEKRVLQHMKAQEEYHKYLFDGLLKKYTVLPSKLNGVWTILSYGLGFASALLGKKAAMACTVAVEEVIEEHYDSQLDSALPEDIHDVIRQCQADEKEHKNQGLLYQGKSMRGSFLFHEAIKAITKGAIALSKRV